MKLLLVANPKAGSAGGVAVEELVEALRPAGEVTHSEGGDEDEVAAAARDADAVIAAGGDGTLHLVLNALSDRLDRVTLGLIPMGTGNDLARTLVLPEDPLDAAAVIAAGKTQAIDFGRVRSDDAERLFINACMGGFPVRVDEAVEDDHKERLGPLAFWWGGLKAAAGLERTAVTVDGEKVDDCVAVGVGNGKTAGGGIEVWPKASPDDGLFDIAVLPAASNLDALTLVKKVKGGTHEELDEVVYRQAASFRIEAEDPVPFNVDGEILGFETPLTFEVAGAVRMFVP